MGDYPGAMAVRYLDNDLVMVVYPMLFNDRICIGSKHDLLGYDRAFCFPKGGIVLEVMEDWDGEGDPPGPWIKEVGTTRYGPGSISAKESR